MIQALNGNRHRVNGRMYRQHSPQRFSGRRVEVAESTGPLSLLEDCAVEVLLDVENLRGGAKDLDCKVSFTKLAELLKIACGSCMLHAFFSRQPGDQRQDEYLANAGYRTHPRDIETVVTFEGQRRLSNSDSKILFAAGHYLSRSRSDTVVLASGDGDLVCELARGIASLPKSRRILTLSLAGSTSFRLDAKRNSLIDGNLEIGRDAMRPWHRRVQRFQTAS